MKAEGTGAVWNSANVVKDTRLCNAGWGSNRQDLLTVALVHRNEPPLAGIKPGRQFLESSRRER